jgi:O-antigen/teichoic acid export membrane protein
LFTPLGSLWYRVVSGLPADLVAFAFWPGAFLVLLPVLETYLSYQRGLLVKAGRTRPISLAVAAQLTLTTAVFLLLISGLKTVGALAVGLALTAGYVAGNVVLYLLRGKRGGLRLPGPEIAEPPSTPVV